MNKFTFLSAIILISCGPNANEEARLQKIREDSIRIVTENETKLKIERKIALTQEANEIKSIRSGHENRLSSLKIELEVQKDKLNRIKQPQLLRTPAEREQHIREQLLAINQQEKDIQEMQEKIAEIDKKSKEIDQELKKYE